MRILALAACMVLAAATAQAAFFTDNFDGTALDARWASSTTGTYSVGGGQLTAQMSNTLYANPLVWNLITTDAPVGDFIATMKCSVAGAAGYLPSVGIGLFSDDHQSLVMTAEEEDHFMWGEFSNHLKYGIVTAQGTVTAGTAFPFTLIRAMVGKSTTNVPFYLQISRSGGTYTLASSLDGGTFTTDWTGAYSGTSELTQLGMSFFGSNGTAQNGYVDWVTVAAASVSTFWSADFNHDHVVDFKDYIVLEGNFGKTGQSNAQGDADANTIVDFKDYIVLEGQFGKTSTPEPATLGLLIAGGLALLRRKV